MTFIIAEAGVNHNGDPDLAFKLVDAAVEAGADAVKFQTFKADKLATSFAAKAAYQKITTSAEESQKEMLKRLELPYDLHFLLNEYCQNKGIQFLSSAFDFLSLEFLLYEVKLEILKLSSGEITNGPFLLAHARSGRKIILSTGMATLGEIEVALGVLAFGYIWQGSEKPSISAFESAYLSKLGQKSLREKVTLLHCTTQYPTPLSDINLRAMDTLMHAFGLKVGYSDHSEGINVSIAAVARGATVIEKHFTLDRNLPGPDHKASLEPDELQELTSAIRSVELALGNAQKGPCLSEVMNRNLVRKSIVANDEINVGDVFTEKNLSIKRPGDGRSPMEYWSLLGETSSKKLKVDEKI